MGSSFIGEVLPKSWTGACDPRIAPDARLSERIDQYPLGKRAIVALEGAGVEVVNNTTEES